MKPYRDAHAGEGAGLKYDAMHETRVDSLIWRNFVRPYVRSIMQSVADNGATNYLDFACGTGRVLKVGADLFDNTTGIDISMDMLQVAHERVPNAELHCVDVTRDSLAAQSDFQCVTMFRFILNAEPELRQEALKWVANHMSSGATLIINNHRNSFSAHGLIARISRPRENRERNVLSRSETVHLLDAAGFSVESCEGYRILPTIHGRPLLGRWVQLQGERLCRSIGMARFGAELVFVARRK